MILLLPVKAREQAQGQVSRLRTGRGETDLFGGGNHLMNQLGPLDLERMRGAVVRALPTWAATASSTTGWL